ncbi:hypothetical protein KSP40_PGU021762 [Platanthera guangdongensis]|uniref:Uncharacterized protein n=1 Tax=Platanthera guangdongensis TaxID=2320717 RepID=A0ABR2MFV6_9ASPA
MALQVEQQTQNFCTFMSYFSSVDIAKYTLTMVYEFLKHLHIHFRSRVNSRRHMKMEFLKQTNDEIEKERRNMEMVGDLNKLTGAMVESFFESPIEVERREQMKSARVAEETGLNRTPKSPTDAITHI